MLEIKTEIFLTIIVVYLGFGVVMGFGIANHKNWQPTIEHNKLMEKCRVDPSQWDCQVYLKRK